MSNVSQSFWHREETKSRLLFVGCMSPFAIISIVLDFLNRGPNDLSSWLAGISLTVMIPGAVLVEVVLLKAIRRWKKAREEKQQADM